MNTSEEFTWKVGNLLFSESTEGFIGLLIFLSPGPIVRSSENIETLGGS